MGVGKGVGLGVGKGVDEGVDMGVIIGVGTGVLCSERDRVDVSVCTLVTLLSELTSENVCRALGLYCLTR